MTSDHKIYLPLSLSTIIQYDSVRCDVLCYEYAKTLKEILAIPSKMTPMSKGKEARREFENKKN
jgi:hypothetical protein